MGPISPEVIAAAKELTLFDWAVLATMLVAAGGTVRFALMQDSGRFSNIKHDHSASETPERGRRRQRVTTLNPQI
ncbi:MAG: hypothetical protein HY053_03075 [Proteobacteria bacterium]|nr:hypothetical protein [Pseudomonadota bacterium]